eukprot:TRINITY_DN2502_c0_g1_i1.p1 TRINITY_DN2502_c0_g1~~TRINITY_DN2502_c0_g1_i1.p1  ORF type:complete len:325 (-),score=57.08 TRINITY_DN2502_c0_g1_i1:101-1075(-)
MNTDQAAHQTGPPVPSLPPHMGRFRSSSSPVMKTVSLSGDISGDGQLPPSADGKSAASIVKKWKHSQACTKRKSNPSNNMMMSWRYKSPSKKSNRSRVRSRAGSSDEVFDMSGMHPSSGETTSEDNSPCSSPIMSPILSPPMSPIDSPLHSPRSSSLAIRLFPLKANMVHNPVEGISPLSTSAPSPHTHHHHPLSPLAQHSSAHFPPHLVYPSMSRVPPLFAPLSAPMGYMSPPAGYPGAPMPAHYHDPQHQPAYVPMMSYPPTLSPVPEQPSEQPYPVMYVMVGGQEAYYPSLSHPSLGYLPGPVPPQQLESLPRIMHIAPSQ